MIRTITCPYGQPNPRPWTDTDLLPCAYYKAEEGMTCVLIADSDPSARNALTVLLSRKYAAKQIHYADDIQSLTTKLEVLQNCVVLISDQLPGVVFPMTCEKIRYLYPQARLVILSVDPTARTEIEQCGAVFIHKGESIKVIFEQLDKVLSRIENLPE